MSRNCRYTKPAELHFKSLNSEAQKLVTLAKKSIENREIYVPNETDNFDVFTLGKRFKLVCSSTLDNKIQIVEIVEIKGE